MNGGSDRVWWHDLSLVVLLAAGVALGHVLGYSASGVVHPDGHIHLDHAFPYLTTGALLAVFVLVARLARTEEFLRPSARRFVLAHVASYLVLEVGEQFVGSTSVSDVLAGLTGREVLFGLAAQVVVAVAARRLLLVAADGARRLAVSDRPLLVAQRRIAHLASTSVYLPRPVVFSTSRVSRGPPMSARCLIG